MRGFLRSAARRVQSTSLARGWIGTAHAARGGQRDDADVTAHRSSTARLQRRGYGFRRIQRAFASSLANLEERAPNRRRAIAA